MDRICQYSTIIFAGNVSVLLIVAISTDYWEYRGFKTEDLIPKLKKMHTRLKLFFPKDTNSYFVVNYYWDPPPIKTSIFATTPIPKKEEIVANYSLVYYQPPVVLMKKMEEYIETEYTLQFDGKINFTIATPVRKKRSVEDSLVLYVQYTNLFRECDILEVGVRQRLGLSSLRNHRCFNFISSSRSNDFISQEIPAAMHLERIAFTMSLVCIAVSLISLVSGAYGLIAHNRSYILTASSAACASGIAMTVSIAIFHGKCHLIHRHEFLAGVELPFKKTVSEFREHYYGWSFVLAWICVVLCFVHTWVWLAKAQDMPDLCLPGRRKWGLGLFRVNRRRRFLRRRFRLAGKAEKLRKQKERQEHNKKKRGSLMRWESTRHLNIQDFALLTQKISLGVVKRDKSYPLDENLYSAIPKASRKVENHEGQPPITRNRRWSEGCASGPGIALKTKLEAAALNGFSVGNIYKNHIDACSLKKCSSGEYYKVLQRPKSEFKILVQPTEFKMYKQPCDCDYTAWKYPSESKLLSQRFAENYKIISSRSSKSHSNIRNAYSNVNIRSANSHSNIHKANSHTYIQHANSHANIHNANSQTDIPNVNSYTNIHPNFPNANSLASIPDEDGPTDFPNADSVTNIPNAYSHTHIPNAKSYANIPNAYSPTDIPNTDSYANISNAISPTEIANTDSHSSIPNAYSHTSIQKNESHTNIPNAYSQTDFANVYVHPNIPNANHFASANSLANIPNSSNHTSIPDTNCSAIIPNASSYPNIERTSSYFDLQH